mgnify:FL=1
MKTNPAGIESFIVNGGHQPLFPDSVQAKAREIASILTEIEYRIPLEAIIALTVIEEIKQVCSTLLRQLNTHITALVTAESLKSKAQANPTLLSNPNTKRLVDNATINLPEHQQRAQHLIDVLTFYLNSTAQSVAEKQYFLDEIAKAQKTLKK